MPSLAEKPLKLLFVVNVFHPDQLGGAVIFTDLAGALKEKGLAVKVRCAFPYYPEWKDKSGENGWTIKDEVINGLDVSRFGLYIPSRPKSLFQRLRYEWSFFVSLSRRLNDVKESDVIMVFCPLMGAVAFGRLAKFLFKKPLWLNVQDLPAQAAQSGNISGGKTAAIFAWIQKRLFSGYDIWSSISPVMINSLSADNPKSRPIHYVPNFLNSSLAHKCALLPTKPEKLGRTTRLFYSGNIGSKQNLIDFCKYLHTTNLDFSFRIQGGGSDAAEVEQWVQESKDDRFSFGAFLEETAFIEELHKSDFCVITERAGSGGSFIPSKIIPAVASQCPVLAISDSDSPLGVEMKTHGIGPHIEWAELTRSFEVLFKKMNRSDQYEYWLDKSKERALFYDRDTVANTYYTQLVKLYTSYN